MAGIDVPGRKQAGANGDEDRGDEHEGCVVAYRSYENASYESGDDVGHYKRKVHDARFRSGDGFDGLEPDREVVNQKKVGAA